MQEIVPESARCAQCDSVIPAGSAVCVMCGAPVDRAEAEGDALVAPSPITDEASEPDAEAEQAAPQELAAPIPPTFRPLQPVDGAPGPETVEGVDGRPYIESRLIERQSHIVFWMTGAVFVITAMLGSLILRYGGPVQVALFPTSTPLPATATLTPSTHQVERSESSLIHSPRRVPAKLSSPATASASRSSRARPTTSRGGTSAR